MNDLEPTRDELLAKLALIRKTFHSWMQDRFEYCNEDEAECDCSHCQVCDAILED